MPINIVLIDARVAVGHGETPQGEKAMGIRFIDPLNGISIDVTFAGEGLKDFLEQIKPPSTIEIAQGIPTMGFPPNVA